MSDEYLWDKTGRDREVEALEELLAPLRHGASEAGAAGRAGDPGVVSHARPGSAPRIHGARDLALSSSTASGAAPLGHAARDLSPRSHGARALEPASRRPRRAWIPVLATLAAAAGLVMAVRWWAPDAEPAASAEPIQTVAREIDLREYGTVDVHPGAIVEVLRQTDDDIRLRLERGTIEARITLAARPRLFQVETPATVCVDLGCRYTLTVEADGSTFVRVDSGQVAFEDNGRETWIPRDASCRAWPARGSGTPRWDDAPPELAAAIEVLDRSEPGARRAAAQQVIALCGERRDALSLWHLAHDGDPEVADAAWSALVARVGAPAGVEDPRAASAAEAWKLHLEAAWEGSGGGG